MTSATRIDGKAYAETLRARVAAVITEIKEKHKLTPGLAVVLVGDDPASRVYVKNKGEQTLAVGMKSFEHRLPDDVTEDELLTLVHGLNHDPDVNGILVQLPLPKQINSAAILAAIDPDKDVDGFHALNTGRLWAGGEALVPCTPYGCVLLIKDVLGEGGIAGKHAVVLGRSNIVGKPVAALLLAENATVTVAHSKTQDLPGVCRDADILVAAVGRAEMVKGDWVKPGAVVVDVGINRIPAPERGAGKTRLVGDVAYEEAANVAGAITPVPGGVGPMTIACLLRNTVVATCRQHGFAVPGGI